MSRNKRKNSSNSNQQEIKIRDTRSYQSNSPKEGDTFVGEVVCKDGRICFRSSDGKYITLEQNENSRMAYEEKLKCVLELKGFANSQPYGVVTEILGKSGDPIVEGNAIALKYKINNVFSPEAQKEAEQASMQEISTTGIMDYTSIPIFTIDPTTSKDFDDAIYVEKHDDGTFTLHTAIANVSKYVKPGSNLFNEAIAKGNSFYLGETCYPMLPEVLSNGVCSLNEGKPRYSLNTVINFSKNGKIQSYEISTGVIESKKRLTYAIAEKIHDNTDGAHIEYIKQKKAIDDAYELSSILQKRRYDRGAFDIGSREPEFIMDESRTKVLDIVPGHSETSTKIIESAMIAVNEVWADFADRAKMPFVYRNHTSMDYKDEISLREKLQEFRIELPDNPTGMDLREIIENVKDTNLEEPITALVLRSMPHAFYSTQNEGHLGLGINSDDSIFYGKGETKGERFVDSTRESFFKKHGKSCGFACEFLMSNSNGYGHTTSPIRRGADTLNQIQITSMIEQGTPYYSSGKLSYFCQTLNEQEIVSDKAEREYDNLLTAIWAKDHIGDIQSGVIIENYKGKLNVVNPINHIKIAIPQLELRLPTTKTGTSKNDENYKVGNSITYQIYDAQTIPRGAVFGSENLHKVDSMTHSNSQDFDDDFVM